MTEDVHPISRLPLLSSPDSLPLSPHLANDVVCDLRGVRSASLADQEEFKEVDPTLAYLHVCHVRVRRTELPCQIPLGEPGPLPDLDELLPEYGIER